LAALDEIEIPARDSTPGALTNNKADIYTNDAGAVAPGGDILSCGQAGVAVTGAAVG
jgi:hypothetical protein